MGEVFSTVGGANRAGGNGTCARDRRRIRCLALAAILAGLAPAPCPAQDEHKYEIAPFRVTGVEGSVTLRYNSDEQINSSTAGGLGGASRQKTDQFRTGVFVLTHSYVYHPDFLNMDIGAGPILSLDSFSGNAGSRNDTSTLYDLTARLNFLRDKPYPFSLFYEHLNPTVSIGPAETLILETTRYGANASLRKPLTPVPMYLEAFELDTKGNGVQRIVDDKLRQLTARAYYAFGAGSQSQLTFQKISQDSESGSVGVPILPTKIDTTTASLDTRAVFGSKNQFDLTNLITYSKQDFDIQGGEPFPSVEDTQFFANLYWDYSKDLLYFGTVNLASSDQEIQKTTGHSESAGMTYLMLDSNLKARLQLDNQGSKTDPGSSLDSYGAEGTLDYRRELPLGVLGLVYRIRYASSDSESSQPVADVIGERHVLSGTTPVPLDQTNVIASTVVVSNVTRTQIYVEGIDYLRTVVGDATRVQRLVTGAIFDGQEVLVDYSFQTQGTFSFNTWTHNASSTLRFLRYYETYVRYQNISNNLKSGNPNFPLNDVESWLVGAKADVPIIWNILVGGFGEWENWDETISPFTRQSYEAYIETPIPLGVSASFRATGIRQLVEFDNASDQDVDLTGYRLRLSSRFLGGLTLSAEYNDQRDRGGSLPTSTKYAALRAEWIIRQLTLSLDASRVEETSGPAESKRTVLRALIRRDF